jgi:hypothetical protein
MRWISGSATLLGLLTWSTSLLAYDDNISFAQLSGDNVSAQLSVPMNTCTGGLVPNTNFTTINSAGNQISILSYPVRGDPAGPPCLASVYSSAFVVLGVFPDGTYNVVWSLGIDPATQVTVAASEFTLWSGRLQAAINPVPSTGTFANSVLFVLLLFGAAVCPWSTKALPLGFNYSLKRTAATCAGATMPSAAAAA